MSTRQYSSRIRTNWTSLKWWPPDVSSRVIGYPGPCLWEELYPTMWPIHLDTLSPVNRHTPVKTLPSQLCSQAARFPILELTWVGAVPGGVVEAEAAAAQAADVGAVVPAGDLQGVRASTRRQVPEPVQHQVLSHLTLPSTSTGVRLTHIYTWDEFI